MPRQDKVFVCFQKAEDDTHKLYIYDDVTAYGTFNWSYQADDKDVQQRLMSRVQQLSGVIAQQKSFREQLESMRQQGGEPKPPVPTPKPEPEEKKLTNQLAKLFQNM